MKKKRILGITGGVGAGKSSVLQVLSESFGAKIILADLVAHDLMEPGSEGLSRVTAALGTGFIKEDGSVDKEKLSSLIFHDEAARKTMNAIIHPLVWETIKKEADEAKEPIVVVEAAIFDTAPEGLFDAVGYVYTTKENRILRLMKDRGYTREKCESIMKRQDSEEEYRKRCTFVIDNNGDKETVKEQLKGILEHEIC